MKRGYPGDIARREFIALPAAALALSGCGYRRDPNALVMWAMSYQGDYAPMLMPSFTAATGIPVEVQSIPWTAAHEKLLTAHAGRALPDVVMLPTGWIGEFQLIGALEPVPTPTLLDDLFPGLADSGRIGDRIYAVPWSVAPQVQYYRRDIVAAAGYAAPPEDWDGWRRMAAAIKRRRPDDHVFLMLLNWPGALFNMLSQVRAPMLRDQATRGAFRSPEARAAFAYYASLFADGYAPIALSTEVQDPIASLGAGQFAIWPSGPTTLVDLYRRQSTIALDLWGVARVAGPGGPGPASDRDVSLCVSTGSRRKQDAWALVRHVTSVESVQRFAQLIGSLPARRDAWAGLDFPAERLDPFARQMTDLTTVPMIIEWERVMIEVQLIAERMVRGQLTVDQALVAADARVDVLLAKRRSLVEAGRIT